MKKLVTFLSLAVLIAGLVYTYKVLSTIQNTVQHTPTKIEFSEDQKVLENQIKGLIEEANYCRQKSDCKEAYYGCPFGCGNLINKTYDTSQIELGVQKYQTMGPSCLYDCDRSPQENDIACRNNKCVDLRYLE